MVDAIEVKLDEIDAKIDQIAYAPKYKQSYEIDEMMKKSGGGAGGAMGGAVAVAGGIILAEAMNALVKQSKILTMVQDQIGKALGLLLDLVLLPFLPLLTIGIINLYHAVIALGTIWDKYVKNSGIGADVAGLGKGTPLDQLFDFGKIMAAVSKFIFNDLPIAILSGLAGLLVSAVKWLMDLGKEIGTDLANAVWSVLTPWYVQFALWWTGATKIITDAWNTIVTFITTYVINPIKEAWNNALTALQPLFKVWDILVAGFKGFINGIISLINSALSSMRGLPLIGGLVPGNIPMLDTGGFVTGTGLAVVHKGETVSPAGSPSSIALHFYGLTNDQLPNVIMQTLRQNGARYRL